jgi:predicted Fe-Mo cluster-binding NifX family protein
MRIAISCKGRTLAAEVDPRFGRAAAFLFVDTESGATEAIDNRQNLEAAQGAGIQAARLVAERGTEVVITGHCGPKAFRALTAARIKVIVGVDGTVTEALKEFCEGRLEPAGTPDTEGHWA